MIDFRDKKDSQLLEPAQIREAAKMLEDGVPIEVICKVMKVLPDRLRYLRQQSILPQKVKH